MLCGSHLTNAPPLNDGGNCEINVSANIPKKSECSSFFTPCLFCPIQCLSLSELCHHLSREHIDPLRGNRFSDPEQDMDKDPCIACTFCDFKTFSSIHFNKHAEYDEHQGVIKPVKEMVTKSISAKVRRADAFFYSALYRCDNIKESGANIPEKKPVICEDKAPALARSHSITDVTDGSSHIGTELCVKQMAFRKTLVEDEKLSLLICKVKPDRIKEPQQIVPIRTGLEHLVASSADLEIDTAGKPLLEDTESSVEKCSQSEVENDDFGFLNADENTFVKDSSTQDIVKGTEKERPISKAGRDVDAILKDKTALESSFICWICFKKFVRCLGSEKDLFLKHSKSFCPLARRECDKDEQVEPQLLLFCPKDCSFVATGSDAFSQHISKCGRPEIHTTRDSFTNIQNSFVSQGQLQFNHLSKRGMGKPTRVGGPDTQPDSSLVEDNNTSKESSSALSRICVKMHSLKCDECGGQFSSNFDLSCHMKSHKEENLMTCCECGVKLKSLNKKDSGEEAVRCHLCEKKFSLVAQIKSKKSMTKRKRFPCNECGKWFSSAGNLHIHMAKHTREKPFKCDQCNKQFKLEKSLISHRAMHLGQKLFSCDICKSASFFSSGGLRKHITSVHSKVKTSSCQICKRHFKLKGQLVRHMVTHSGEKPFTCHLCQRRFARKYHLQCHILTHTGEKPHQCPMCEKRFSQSSSLKGHLRRHNGERPHECSDCGKRFEDRNHLQNHIKTIHKLEKLFECNICGKGVSDITSHKRTHTGEKPYSCQVCGRKFCQSSQVKVHMATHTGDRPFHCDVCGKNFRRKTHLQSHMVIHTGERKFKCDVCGNCFSHKTNLKNHLVRHTGEKRFKCKECGKQFGHNSTLKIHMRLHTGIKPYACQFCGSKHFQKGNLKQHIMNIHKGEQGA